MQHQTQKQFAMCDVIEMTSKITSLSRTAFNNRLKLSVSKELKGLNTYNQRIEALVDGIYDVINEIGEEEWKVLKNPLELLIYTTKDLLKTYRKNYHGQKECEDLEGMLSYLIEVQHDIVRFRLPNPKREEWAKMLNEIVKDRMNQTV